MIDTKQIIATKTKCRDCGGDMEIHLPDHLTCTKCGAECWDLFNGVYNEVPQTEEFNYIIARPWNEGDHTNLCYYTYGMSVFHGTVKDARNTREYINKRCDDGKVYSIYIVNPNPIE